MTEKAPLAMTADDYKASDKFMFKGHPIETRHVDLIKNGVAMEQYLEDIYGGVDQLASFSVDDLCQKSMALSLTKRYFKDLKLLEDEQRLPEAYVGQREKFENILNQVKKN